MLAFIIAAIIILPFNAGFWLGSRAGWKAKKFIDIVVRRLSPNYRSPEMFEVEVDDRKYIVGSIDELPERDRELVRKHIGRGNSWTDRFLKNDAPISVRPSSTKEWHPADAEDDTLNTQVSGFPLADERAALFDLPKQPACVIADNSFGTKNKPAVVLFDLSKKTLTDAVTTIEKVRERAPKIRKRQQSSAPKKVDK